MPASGLGRGSESKLPNDRDHIHQILESCSAAAPLHPVLNIRVSSAVINLNLALSEVKSSRDIEAHSVHVILFQYFRPFRSSI